MTGLETYYSKFKTITPHRVVCSRIRDIRDLVMVRRIRRKIVSLVRRNVSLKSTLMRLVPTVFGIIESWIIQLSI